MITTPIILILIAAVLLTGIIVWLVQRSLLNNKLLITNERLQQQLQLVNRLQQQHNELQTEKESLLQQYAKAENQVQFLNEQYAFSKRYQKDNEILQSQLSMFKAKYQSAEEKLESQKKDIEQLGEHFKVEFKNLAQSILEEKSEKFSQLNVSNMNTILMPFKTQLTDFKQKVEDTYDKESKERFSLGKEVQRLIEMSRQVSEEANNLTAALKGNNKMQGNWGEMILESMLENSGLTKGREYFLQEFIRDNTGNIIKDENGKGLQPDVTVCYPDARKVIIDSKVSLVAWEQFIATDDIDEQKKLLQDHTRSLRTHIDGLARRNYPKYALALDYVLLFIPIEPAFLEAVKADAQLWKYAYDKKILLVSPTNFFAVLKIIADLWKIEQQNRHSTEIADKAGALYDKFAGFIENLEMAGKKILEANSAYETAFKQLLTGKGNIINRVEELRKMGANASKQLPSRLLPHTEEE
ncbi:MAG TPA: DNA recombination protein RmuC [Panacibacter sp.]|nr:DNA recombination protein RmuC [Panacibacter sp.]